MLIATAGHIDHGKTTLVRALTGVDTDRLPEEKARGISIDIGFAYWTTPAGQLVGFVDVPGHERFVRNMLAGVTAIDFALLVVAADDGVMPQTREHLQILDLLGVREGLAVLTKVDRVGEARVAQAAEQVRALLQGTALEGAPVLPTAATAGIGMAELRAALEQAALRRRARSGRERNMRYSIDRSFSVAGTGTVVTGTVLDGMVAVGDKLRLSPDGPQVRVRAMHKQGQQAQQAVAGERCALGIVGADPRQASRGHWLVAPRAHAPTERIDARLRVLATEAQPLKHWMPVHFHIGTAEVTARLVMPGKTVAPGASELVQVMLDRPLVATHGDRFIIRDQSAQRTVGGGMVLDPFPSRSRRDRDARAARLAALDRLDPALSLRMLLEHSPAGLDVEVFRRTFNLTPAALQTLLEQADACTPEGERARAFSRTQMEALEAAVMRTLKTFHAASPHLPGMDMDALGRGAAPTLASRVRLAVIRAMAARGALEVHGSLVAQPRHVPAARPGDEQLWRTLEPFFRTWGLNVPQVREVAAQSGVREMQLRDYLKHRARVGDMVRVSAERYYLRATLGTLAQHALDLADRQPQGRFSVADFRDFTGIGRNTAIEVLELFDRLSITQRGGNDRGIHNRDFRSALGLLQK